MNDEFQADGPGVDDGPGSGADELPPSDDDDDSVLDGDDVDPCSRADQAFQDFVATHRACERDDECTVVGDCSPNADFTAVRADASDEAYTLMTARCETAFDGPVHEAICEAGTCVLSDEEIGCCGCDPGFDAGTSLLTR